MKLANRVVTLSSALLLPTLVLANDQALTETLSAFTNCDARFFDSLHAQRDSWKSLAPLQDNKSISWIAVENRADDDKNSVLFQNAPRVAGLELISYFDQSSDLDELGYYLFWGFTVKGQPEKVAKHLKPLLKEPEQLRSFAGTYVRSEIRTGDRWQVIRPLKGAPGTSRLERVLIVEPDAQHGNQTRISCSMQGAIDPASLAEVRPDIPAAEYPKPTQVEDISDIAVPDKVLKSLELPLLQPKFKSLKYTFATSKNGKSDNSPVSIVIRSEGTLSRKTEIYSESFQVERLTKADLIQLKSKLIGIGDGRVRVTREIELEAPTSWKKGDTLRVRSRAEYTQSKAGDKPMEHQMDCTVGQRFPASQVYASLEGDAIELKCEFEDYRTVEAFIEDLGTSIQLQSTSSNGKYVYEITALEVDR
ncbi:hypothetical protein [Pseudomonas sp. URMO17WK12:I4]|uniref:hypothetical protein n=1 Tax=Pseudomonas sp. URMO17WK12:I4 TaxID=1283292 RepID=UPI00048574F6|nr:hypothetical protein [Pseudomonas sp. URMO17WK12:I4]